MNALNKVLRITENQTYEPTKRGADCEGVARVNRNHNMMLGVCLLTLASKQPSQNHLATL